MEIERGVGKTFVHLAVVGALHRVVGNESLSVVHPYKSVETATSLHLFIWIYMQVASEFSPVRICLAAVSKEGSLSSRHEVYSAAAFHYTAPICISRRLYRQFLTFVSQDGAVDYGVAAGGVLDAIVESLAVGYNIGVDDNVVNVVI